MDAHEPAPISTSAPLRAAVVEDPEALASHIEAWDALAVQQGMPFCAPAWMLSWWHEARTGDARLRIVLVTDEEGLVGVGPFFAQVGLLGLVEMRLLAAGFCHRIGPLAKPGRERAVAEALAVALAGMKPSPASVVFEGIDATDRWPELIATAWPSPRQPRLRTDARMDAPIIDLGGSYDTWLGSRDRHFRKEARRTARRMAEAHVESRVANDAEAIDALVSLHGARWAGRGGSNVGTRAEQVILGAARQLQDGHRLSVALLEAPDGPVAAELVLQAGDTAVFWGGGFDPRWARNAPGTQAILLALRTLAARGARTADLGGGEHEYKQRLADGNRPLVWRTLFPLGSRYPLIRARLVPKHVVFVLRGLVNRLPIAQREQLKRLLRRVGGRPR
jgi:CelD/BcsL family acetyltransferase involved in cellulose biosynthesis